MFFIAVKQLFFAVTAWNDLCFTFYFGSHFESGIQKVWENAVVPGSRVVRNWAIANPYCGINLP